VLRSDSIWVFMESRPTVTEKVVSDNIAFYVRRFMEHTS
jgi:hypothetical protein